MLGPNPRVVQAGGDGVRLDDLAVGVLEQVAQRAVQDARLALRDGGAVLPQPRLRGAGGSASGHIEHDGSDLAPALDIAERVADFFQRVGAVDHGTEVSVLC